MGRRYRGGIAAVDGEFLHGDSRGVAIGVLGPLRVDGQTDALRGRDRVVLAALVARFGEPLSSQALADALWGEAPPASWAKVVQGCVVRLRKRLGPAAIESGPTGYRLVVSGDELDTWRFEHLLDGAREALDAEDSDRAAHVLRDALRLWTGRALEDLVEWEPGRVAATRLEGLRLDAEELLVEADTLAGRARGVLERARVLTANEPFRERRWVLLSTALYAAGRQREALAAVAQARTMLAEELGLDACPELVQLEQRILRQDPALSPPLEKHVSDVCPYRGLLAYRSEDADAYFGREDDVSSCLRRLRDTGVLAVVGPSGTGKSSLVRAGVLASLARDGAALLVTNPGVDPVASLRELGPRGRQTLVVDQAEEAMTLCPDPALRATYFAMLAAHVGAGGRLVIAVRADHLARFASYPDVARVLEGGIYLLGPMGEAELRRAIEGPARRAGLRLEPGLVDLLVREVAGAPAALPMLSYVLRATWERREGHTLTVEGYRASGGIRDAVARTVEAVYQQLDGPGRRGMRDLCLRLVIATEDGEAVRARVPRASLAVDEDHLRVVELLAAARLVSIDGEAVEIAHEALVRAWPRLRGWLDEDSEGQRIRRHLTVAADTWEAMQRPGSELYRGTRLARALQWRTQVEPELSSSERAFLEAGQHAAEAEERDAIALARQQRRVNRRLRGLLGAVVGLLVVAVVAGAVAAGQSDRAARSARESQARRVAALSQLTDRDDLSLLLALAAVRVDRSRETVAGLVAAVSRNPALARFTPTGQTPSWLDVNPVSGQVAVVDRAARVHLYDGRGVPEVATYDPQPPGWSTEVFCVCDPAAFSPDGEILVLGVPSQVHDPVRLLDGRTLVPLRRQLRGQPRQAIPTGASFSADGSRVAVSFDRYDAERNRGLGPLEVVWDTARPERPILRVRPIGDLVHLRMSPAGDRLYVVPGWNSDLPAVPLQTIEVSTGRTVVSRTGPHSAMALSPDGSVVAAVRDDQVVLLDAATWRETRRLTGLPVAEDGEVEFSADGSLLAATGGEGAVGIWDLRSGLLRQRIETERADFADDVRFSPDGERLLTVTDTGLWSFDLSGRERYVRRTAPPARKVQETWDSRFLSPTGDTVVAQVRRGTTQRTRVFLVDVESGAETNVRGPGWLGTDFTGSWRPDGRRLVIVSPTSLYVVDVSTGRVLARRDLSVEQADYTADGSRIVARLARGWAVLDAATLATLSRPLRPDVGHVVDSLVTPSDSGLVALTADQPRAAFDFTQVEGWALVDLGDGSVVGRGDFGIRPHSAALSPDGARLAVAGGGQLEIVDLASGKARGSGAALVETESDGLEARYSPDGRRVVTADGTGRLSLWDGRTADLLGTVRLGNALVSPAFLPDSRTVRIAAADGSVYEWDTSVERARAVACHIVGRSLTVEEWEDVMPSVPFETTCPASR